MPYRFVFWILVHRLFLLRDWKLLSSASLFGWSWCLFQWIDGGYFADLFLEFEGLITFDSRLGVGALIQGLLWTIYGDFPWLTGGREVVGAN